MTRVERHMTFEGVYGYEYKLLKRICGRSESVEGEL